MNQNDFYKLKYSKYKSKYLELKNKNLLDQKGGIANKSGNYLFYVSIQDVEYQLIREVKYDVLNTKSEKKKYNLKYQKKAIKTLEELKDISFHFHCGDSDKCDNTNNIRNPKTNFQDQQKEKYKSEGLEEIFPRSGNIYSYRRPADKENIKKYAVIKVIVNQLLPNEILEISYVQPPWTTGILLKDTGEKYEPIFKIDSVN